jgi:hypothetical protein
LEICKLSYGTPRDVRVLQFTCSERITGHRVHNTETNGHSDVIVTSQYAAYACVEETNVPKILKKVITNPF